MTDEENDWLYFTQIPLTVKAPDPSDRARQAAEWFKTPAVMLNDLTKTLNTLLSCCRYHADDPELLEVDSDEVGILPYVIEGYLLNDTDTLRIRNSIQATPLNLEFIDDVRKHFHVCCQCSVELQSLRQLTDAVWNYQFQLQILADWIEARGVADQTPPQWSAYRTPAEWRVLLGKAGKANSERTWTDLRKNNSDQMEGDSKSVRITRALAHQWGLKLPEFTEGTRN